MTKKKKDESLVSDGNKRYVVACRSLSMRGLIFRKGKEVKPHMHPQGSKGFQELVKSGVVVEELGASTR